MSKTTINDMTVGSPAKLIIQFMIPMCLGNLFQQFYNVVDSIVAGQFLGVQALAAIGSKRAPDIRGVNFYRFFSFCKAFSPIINS